jgi:hypothetical protein
MKTTSQQRAAIRYKKVRKALQDGLDHVRAAERAAIALGLCPRCGSDVVNHQRHDVACASSRQ